MVDSQGREQVVPVHNLRDFFRTSVDDAAERQGVAIEPQTTQYVVNLLTLYSRSEALYDHDGECYGLRPLALMLADAAQAESTAARSHHLQRIGDVALFVSGFFIDSLAERAVDVDYYIHMGGNAYGSLSDELRGTFRGIAFSDIYRELAAKFGQVVDVLNDVRDGGNTTPSDVQRLYEVWRKTGSQRAKTQLESLGITPMVGGPGPRRH